jgi:putative flavoprotein involved in K+ transport
VPRRYRGRDAWWWLQELGALDTTVTDLPGGVPPPSVLLTGFAGGHDMTLRGLKARGIIHGRLRTVHDGVVMFDDDAERIATAADAASAQFIRSVEAFIVRHGMDVPESTIEPLQVPLECDSVELDLRRSGVGTVIWCTGYQYDLGWVHAPLVDDRGAPVQRRGVTPCAGLYVLGLHWMDTVKSGLLFGVCDDAEHVIGAIAEQLPANRV